jgi:hypothetical protein
MGCSNLTPVLRFALLQMKPPDGRRLSVASRPSATSSQPLPAYSSPHPSYRLIATSSTAPFTLVPLRPIIYCLLLLVIVPSCSAVSAPSSSAASISDTPHSTSQTSSVTSTPSVSYFAQPILSSVPSTSPLPASSASPLSVSCPLVNGAECSGHGTCENGRAFRLVSAQPLT